jgi:hypothetical protein
MSSRSFQFVLIILAFGVGPTAEAQKARTKPVPLSTAQTATMVSAELVRGKLGPAYSRPGDRVELRLKDDLKSNGVIVLKKGAVLTGLVRSVKQIDVAQAETERAKSVVNIEWVTPPSQGGVRQLMIALQHFTQPMPIEDEPDTAPETGGSTADLRTSPSVVNGQSNAALMSMPSVVAADRRTGLMLRDQLNLSGDPQFFRTGQGEVISRTGSRQSVDLFSRMTNDTILASDSEDFVVTAGAQMQFVVGMTRK